MSPRKIPDFVLSKSLTTHAAIDRLVAGIDEIERDFSPGKCITYYHLGVYSQLLYLKRVALKGGI